MMFIDRIDAGRRLGAELGHLRGDSVVVVGLPRGGVPVGEEVARSLGAPLEVIVVRKLGVPFHSELSMGAIGEDAVRIVNTDLTRAMGIPDGEFLAVEARERTELDRRANRFRAGRPRIPLTGRTVVIVDDGIATGSTARAACQVARAHGAAHIVLAVPVAPSGWTAHMAGVADELVCLSQPERFLAIGQFYDDFSQISDEEVVACLARRTPQAAVTEPAPDYRPASAGDVVVAAGPTRLEGHLTFPRAAVGIVVFAHGSGSSRHSSRNRHVAAHLNRHGLGTLLFDLLTPAEETDRANVFDIELLARRLVGATNWLRTRPDTAGLSIGYFGANTGAAAALWAAGEPDIDIAAVVSRGGRPDLATGRLAAVTAPTLLIVGGPDDGVLEFNRSARTSLRCRSRLAVVPGATHPFEEPGSLEMVAGLASDWFTTHLAPAVSEARA